MVFVKSNQTAVCCHPNTNEPLNPGIVAIIISNCLWLVSNNYSAQYICNICNEAVNSTCYFVIYLLLFGYFPDRWIRQSTLAAAEIFQVIQHFLKAEVTSTRLTRSRLTVQCSKLFTLRHFRECCPARVECRPAAAVEQTGVLLLTWLEYAWHGSALLNLYYPL